MLSAITGVLASRSISIFDTFNGVDVIFPVNLSAMPSTAKTFSITMFPVVAKTGFGIALGSTPVTFPVQAATGFGIALGFIPATFPVQAATGFGIALGSTPVTFPVNVTR